MLISIASIIPYQVSVYYLYNLLMILRVDIFALQILESFCLEALNLTAGPQLSSLRSSLFGGRSLSAEQSFHQLRECNLIGQLISISCNRRSGKGMLTAVCLVF